MRKTDAVRHHAAINPTLILYCCAIGAIYFSSWFAYTGALSYWHAALLNVVAIYAMYTVMHDAAHGIAHHVKWLNDLMGRVCAFHEGITFQLFRLSHMQHHRYTNHPMRDPDYVIGRKPRWLFPIWVIVRLLHDNAFMISQKLWRRRELVEHLFTVTLQIATVFLLARLLGWSTVIWLWLIPLVVAGALVEITVAWLVHFPHESTRAYEHTRLLRSRVLQVLMLNHNLHLVHHVWPRTPWYQYGKRLGELDSLLVQKLNTTELQEE